MILMLVFFKCAVQFSKIPKFSNLHTGCSKKKKKMKQNSFSSFHDRTDVIFLIVFSKYSGIFLNNELSIFNVV